MKFGPNPAWEPIFSQFRCRLTTPPRLWKSPGRSELALPGDLWSLGGVVKRLPNWLKIGPQAGFGPNFTVELEAGFRKKIGLAYWPFCKTVHLKTCFENDLANWCDQALRAIRQRYPNLAKLHSNTLHKKSHKPKEGFQVNSSNLFCFSFASHQCSEWKWINLEKEVRSNQASFKDWINILKEWV